MRTWRNRSPKSVYLGPESYWRVHSYPRYAVSDHRPLVYKRADRLGVGSRRYDHCAFFYRRAKTRWSGNPGSRGLHYGLRSQRNPDSGDYTLAANSPALGSGEGGADMGAFGVGCGIINQVWHVSTTGSDVTGDGSADNPFATIQHGIDAAINGDTVLVAAGTYTENVSLNKTIVLMSSEGADSTIIDANNFGTVVTITDGSDATLDGFILQNGYTSGSNTKSGGLIVLNNDAVIKNCIIRNNQGHQGGGIYSQAGSFYNCQIIGNTAEFTGGGVEVNNIG